MINGEHQDLDLRDGFISQILVQPLSASFLSGFTEVAWLVLICLRDMASESTQLPTTSWFFSLKETSMPIPIALMGNIPALQVLTIGLTMEFK